MEIPAFLNKTAKNRPKMPIFHNQKTFSKNLSARIILIPDATFVPI